MRTSALEDIGHIACHGPAAAADPAPAAVREATVKEDMRCQGENRTVCLGFLSSKRTSQKSWKIKRFQAKVSDVEKFAASEGPTRVTTGDSSD